MPLPRALSLGALVLLACAAIAIGLAAARTHRDPVGPAPGGDFEALRAGASYETSRTCAPCHPQQHASWSRTFHRTMTQVATPESVVAPFDGRTVAHPGGSATVTRQGDDFAISLPARSTWKVETHPIVMTVGSRRMQQFVAGAGDHHERLPFAWSIDEQRWFHLSEAFFQPGGALHDHQAIWDLNCIFCHNVKARPGLRPDGSISSSVAELGIACEACHGPGEVHAERMRNPFRRYLLDWRDAGDPTIVNPSRLSQERSVQVCGHCHGQRVPTNVSRVEDIFLQGDPFTPGESLAAHWTPIQRDTTTEGLTFATRFWKDGSARLTAYEMQGVQRSPCYAGGEMTCLTCHAMHEGDPRGQLRPDRLGDAACLSCHADDPGLAIETHAQHAPESSGARCVACHMPPTVYGIMTWHPTHEIRNPDPGHAARHDMPDACTTCHAGRSRAWAQASADRMWPGRATEGLPDDVSSVAPHMARALFAGDAVHRTLAAERLGKECPDPRCAELAIPLLAEALLDEYPNVRRTAGNTLRELTGQEIPRALDPLEDRLDARSRLQIPLAQPAPEGWPFDAAGLPDRALIARWMTERKDAPVHVGE